MLQPLVIQWKDYGVYEQTAWSPKGTKNEFTSDQIHFPNIATTGQRRGWALDEIVSIGAGSITVNTQYDFNATVGFGTDATVKVAHDNTYALSEAIDDTIASGGNYLDLPSGTYLAQKLILPTSFTLRGNGRNTVLKQQFFANDATDGGGNNLALDGNFVGIGTTNGKDVTVQDLTIDGNSGNNITFQGELGNYLVYFKGVSSSLFKSMEVRNSPAHGLYIYDSSRVSVENASFVDGSLTDRYPFEPIQAQESDVLRINDSLFENYPGPVDVSVTTVVSTGGNIIRNCGTGLRTYATGKITTSNNIILGPSDELFHHQTFMIVTSTLSTSRLTERQTSKDLFFSTSIRVMLRTLALVRSLLHLLVSELSLVRELPMRLLEPDLLTLISPLQTVEHLEERMVTFNFPCHCPRPVKLVSAVLLDTILSHRNSCSNLLDSLHSSVLVLPFGIQSVLGQLSTQLPLQTLIKQVEFPLVMLLNSLITLYHQVSLLRNSPSQRRLLLVLPQFN